MSHEDQNLKNIGDKSKDSENGSIANPENADQDMEFSEIGKPVINKKIPKNVPGIDSGRWAD